MIGKASKPRNIATTGSREVAIAWGDGHESYYPYDTLRRSCPCASCRASAERRPLEGPLRVVSAPQPGKTDIVRIEPVGAYALRIVWSDGHDAGIFSFQALRASCLCQDCSPP